jgi:cell wall-associated NlpC family hydrolase
LIKRRPVVMMAAIVILAVAAGYPAHADSTHRRRTTLTSRGLPSETVTSSVVGRLAVVTADKSQIMTRPDRWGRLLSTCRAGQYLAINSESELDYGVLMIDRSIGFIRKSDVTLLAYQVVDTSPAAQPGSLADRLVQTARQYLGVPYVWGGNTYAGIDCSGFVKAVFDQNGIDLPRHSGDQANIGYDVPKTDISIWVPGDRLYFACHHPEIDHTGMYIGQGYFIHASASHDHQVAIDRVDNPYFYGHLVAVRRSRELYLDTVANEASAQPTATQPQAADNFNSNNAAVEQNSSAQAPTGNNASTSSGNTDSANASSTSISDDRVVPPASDTSVSTTDPEANQQ